MLRGNAFDERKPLEAIFYEVTNLKLNEESRERRDEYYLLTYWVLQSLSLSTLHNTKNSSQWHHFINIVSVIKILYQFREWSVSRFTNTYLGYVRIFYRSSILQTIFDIWTLQITRGRINSSHYRKMLKEALHPFDSNLTQFWRLPRMLIVIHL